MMAKVGIMSFAHMHAYSYASCLQQIPDAELAGIFDDDSERGLEAAEKFGTLHHSNLESFLNMDLDAVIICSENSRHKEMVLRAAMAGKHIMCEKPISTNVKDAEDMIAVCEANGVILQTAFPVRFSSAIQSVKQMIDNGELGKILAMRTTNRGQNPGGWFVDLDQSGGGAVLDHTVHMVDIMRWYLGKEIREVHANTDHFFIKDDIDDAGLLTLEFEDGTIASHDTSWSRFSNYPAWGDATIEVIGTKKTARADAFGDQIRLFSNSSNQSLTYVNAGNDIDLGLVEDFVNTVNTGGNPSITGYDGLKAMEVALAAYESSRTGKPVSL
jgi:predicted dehydrogenase